MTLTDKLQSSPPSRELDVEDMARAIWSAMLETGLANNVRDWDEKSGYSAPSQGGGVE